MIATQCREVPTSNLGDWHAWRAKGIGASEAASALGISPYATSYELYLRKLGLLPDVAENDAMLIGKLQEPVIAQLYAHKTGRQIVRTQVGLESVDYPFLRATIDGFDEDGIPVEFKTANIRQASEWGTDADEIPEHYLCQVHHQLLVTGSPRAHVALLLAGSEFRTYTIEADERIAEMLVHKLGEFWDRVERRDPPEPTFADSAVIARLRPTIDATIELGQAECDHADLYASIGEEIKTLESQRAEAKAWLIHAMEGHAAASLPDGRTITRKAVTRKSYTVAETSYIDMRFKTPKGR